MSTPIQQMFTFITIGFGLVVLASLVFAGVRMVHTQTVAIVERFGKFNRMLKPGLNFIIPLVERIPHTVDLRVREVKGSIDIKTNDNMFVKMPVALMIQANDHSADSAYYLLQNSEKGGHGQVATWALSALRAAAAGMSLEELFQNRDQLASEVKNALDAKMAKYGYNIVDVLVDQPSVSDEVQASFNRVVASKREREAAEQQAEAKRILILGEARAESEAQGLRAEGVARARTVLADSLTKAMESAKAKGIDETEVLGLLLETNRLDTIRSASEHGKLVLMDLRSPVPLTLNG